MNSANFKRRKKSREDFVSGDVEIEDVHVTPSQTVEKEESVKMQIYLTQTQRE